MCKVSVIVPVYNVQDYLERCLDSLVRQTLQEIQIILVNDGSTDESFEIMNRYALLDDRIEIFSKTNGGLSDARNFGLQKCRGEYIGFVDSDDFVEPEMFELLYTRAKAKSADIVECNLRHTFEDTEDTEIGIPYTDKVEMLIYGRSVVWNKIYLREWLIETGIIFPKGLIYEDVQFYIQLVPHIRTYEYIPEALIHYVQRNNSLNNYSTIRTMDILEILNNILNYYKEFGYYEQYKKALEMFFARILLCSSFSRMVKIHDASERKNALKRNWEFLMRVFPEWKKNPFLKNEKSLRAFYMKTITFFTYKIYASLFLLTFQIRNKR